MKLRSMGLLVSAVAMLAACAGEKNEASGENTILAVRTADASSGLSGDDATEVALISGDLATPEEAQIAAENATWVPISKFKTDDELGWMPVDQGAQATMSHDNDDYGYGNNNQSQSQYQQQSQSQNNGGNQSQYQQQQQWQYDGNQWQVQAQAQGQFQQGDRFRGQDRNWTPHRQPQRWQSRNQWKPKRQVYNRYPGFQTCGTDTIYYGGRCVTPCSYLYGSYKWKARYGYEYTPRRYQTRNSVSVSAKMYVRFYF